jgi:S1-C subfamily serine protease/tetratricopeptide (TPR) repeat protein
MSRQRGGRPPAGIGVGGGVAAIGFAAFCAFQTLRLRPPAATAAAPAPAAQLSPATDRSPRTALSPDVLFARAAPAVVRINVSDGAARPLGHGTGFFVSADGLVVTNYHVIDGANYATIERSDGGVLRVEGVVALDGASDLVLLKVTPADATPLPTLPVGPSEPPRVGTTVYAIGHPLGLRNVLSEGLVSGLGDARRGQRFIQTTAAISPGSSGGPLMTADGVVVGVTTATVRDAQNLNFAMPASRIRALLGQPHATPPLPLSRALAERVAARPAPGMPDRALDRALDRVWDAMKRDRMDEAAALVAQLRRRGQDSAYYWFTCGSVHMRLHNDDLAVDAFQSSLRLNADKAATYLNLGQVYARQHKLKEAVTAFEAAAKLEPHDPRPYAQAGYAYVSHARPQNAVPFFQRAIQLEPANAAHHLALGVAYADLRQREAAVACFEKAVELEPGDGRNHCKLGVALLYVRRNEQALGELQRAVSLKPDDPDAYLYLGYAYHFTGDREAAKGAWANAVRFDTPTGAAGFFARQALTQYERNQEPVMPSRR